MLLRHLLPAALLLCAPLSPAQSLRQLADQRNIRIGAAVNPRLLTEAPYNEALAREFNQVEPENAMKFGPVHPEPERYYFAPADALVSFARENKMAVRGHTLVWHRQNPQWLSSVAPAELPAVLRRHIETVVGHYAGQVYAWDVVNEAFTDDGLPRETVWSPVPNYVEQAFRWAHGADPKALLFYNDYSAEAVNAKSDAIYKMAKDFKARGVPIDGIGLQMHLTAKPPALAGAIDSMEENIKRITALGLQVQITELDVRMPLDSPDPAAQARIYRDVVALCLKYPGCTAIQTWGFTDKYSWIPRRFPGFGAALEFDANYQPKPAYKAIESTLRK